MLNREKNVIGLSAAVVLAGSIVSAAHAGSFTPGDLLVTRFVGGSADLTNSPAPGTVAPIVSAPLAGNGSTATYEIDEYKPDGTFVQAITLPNVQQTSTAAGASYALTGGAGQNNEGTIEASPNGRFFAVVGYNQTANSGATNSNAVDSTTVQRVVGVIKLDGTFDTTTGLQDVSSRQAPKSAFTTDGTQIWVGGVNGSSVTINGVTGISTNGIHYTTIGSTTSTGLITGANGNQRIISAYDFGHGLQMYLSSNSSTTQSGGSGFRGVGTIGDAAAGTSMPTASPTPVLQPVQLPGFENTSDPAAHEIADNYWFKDANTLYIADQRDSSKTGAAFGGVQKWTFNGTSWQFAYNVTLGTSGSFGAHGLSGEIDPLTGNVDLFATNFDTTGLATTSLYQVVDNGTALTATLLKTSDTNSAFRGVTVVPYLRGDANLDNKVDATDLNIVLNNFGKASVLRADGNMDGSATIDLTDLAQVLNNFGQSIGGGAASPSFVAAAVPEPASLALLGLGVAGVLMRRRRA